MNGYIDLHCDSLWAAIRNEKNTITDIEESMLDIRRLRKSGAMAQFFAMFLPQFRQTEWQMEDGQTDLWAMMSRLYEIYTETLAENDNVMRSAASYQEVAANADAGLISSILTIENGALLNGNMDNVQKIYDMGVRLVTLTWNDPNCLGYPHSPDQVLMHQGLTDFGKEAVECMNDMGIIVDVSHLSDGGFLDVSEISKKPFVASHSNCRSLSPSTRNLTDTMIRILAEQGGVAGINFCPFFLDSNLNHPVSRIEAMCDHIMHMMNTGGVDCIAIGTDFDGIDGDLEIRSCTEMALLFDRLKKKGLSDDALDKFMYGNVMRVLKDNE